MNETVLNPLLSIDYVIDLSKLKQDSNRQAFTNHICRRLDALNHSSEDADENWTVFRDTSDPSATDSLGAVSRKHEDWLDDSDEEIQGVFEEKHQKHKANLSDTQLSI